MLQGMGWSKISTFTSSFISHFLIEFSISIGFFYLVLSYLNSNNWDDFIWYYLISILVLWSFFYCGAITGLFFNGLMQHSNTTSHFQPHALCIIQKN
jgi:glycerol uptake facilitator-like aquaporin